MASYQPDAQQAIGIPLKLKVIADPVDMRVEQQYTQWSKDNPQAFVVKQVALDNGQTLRILIFYY